MQIDKETTIPLHIKAKISFNFIDGLATVTIASYIHLAIKSNHGRGWTIFKIASLFYFGSSYLPVFTLYFALGARLPYKQFSTLSTLLGALNLSPSKSILPRGKISLACRV